MLLPGLLRAGLGRGGRLLRLVRGELGAGWTSPRHRRGEPPRSARRHTTCCSGLRGRLEPLLQAGRSWRTSPRRPRQPTLEQRVRGLELEVAALKARLVIAPETETETGTSDVVVELPRPVDTARTPRSRRG